MQLQALSVCVFAALITTFPNLALCDAWRESDFECARLGRRLDDQEILERLRAKIQSNWIAARNLEIPTIDQMQLADPMCCRVVSDPEKNPWARNWEKGDFAWWRRFLETPRMFAYFNFADPMDSGRNFHGDGLLNTCGHVLDMSFSRGN